MYRAFKHGNAYGVEYGDGSLLYEPDMSKACAEATANLHNTNDDLDWETCSKLLNRVGISTKVVNLKKAKAKR